MFESSLSDGLYHHGINLQLTTVSFTCDSLVGVMVSVLVTITEDCGFYSVHGQTRL
jgi:hypothetical protein